jgi:SAM-dependent methyltransferase
VERLPDWVPQGADLTRASAARMYDYYLGGAHNFAVDRELAAQALAAYPNGRLIAQANRAFLHRAVRHLVSQGIRQFIDIGSGIPTVENVHETAQKQAPDARVLYVDHDPVAVAHSELILRGNPNTGVLRADLRRPKEILNAPELPALLDLSQPIGILMVAVLHFVAEDDRPEEAIAALREHVAPGSYLVISQGTGEGREAEAKRVAELYRNTTNPVTYRSRDRIRELFDGWQLEDPGVVWVSDWRPDWTDTLDPAPELSGLAAAVGRKEHPA